MKVIKLTKTIYIFLSIFILIILLTLCNINFSSVKNTTELFIYSVLPSLFPFILFTEIILKSGIITEISKYLSFIPKIFKLSKNAIVPIILGFLCGFPAGSKAIDNLYAKGQISLNDANILISFVNNCSPIFILTTVGISMLGNISIGILLLISHLLSSVIIGFIYSRFYTYTIIHEKNEFLKYSDKNYIENKEKTDITMTKFELLQKCILNSFTTLALIFGFMIIFNMAADVLISLIKNITDNEFILNISSGFFEVTRGVKNISLLKNYLYIIPIISFLLGFSGLSIIFQIKSSFKNFTISFKKLIFFKILHGILSLFIAYILLNCSNIVNIDSLPIFSSINIMDYYKINIFTAYSHCILLIIFILSTFILLSNGKKIK